MARNQIDSRLMFRAPSTACLALGLLLHACASTDTDEDTDSPVDSEPVETDSDADSEVPRDDDHDGFIHVDDGGTDCDDGNAAINPDADELCDPADVDEDCDGGADDADPEGAVDATTWHLDLDGDAWGGDAVLACDPDPAQIAPEGDCDDQDDTIHPDAVDECGDLVDHDCDGVGGPGSDEDGDTLDEATEAVIGTSDCSQDSDLDGLTDDDEYLVQGTDPVGPDSDFDGVLDGDELLVWSTDPFDADTDGDLLTDGYEVDAGFDPLVADCIDWSVDCNGDLQVTLDDAVDSTFSGVVDNGEAGWTVAAGGDVNGDGYGDFLVGSPHEDAGGVYLVFGAAGLSEGVPLDAPEIVHFVGESSGDRAGASLAIGGDVNGDGYADILIGAPAHSERSTEAGAAYLVFGAPDLEGTILLSDPGIVEIRGADHFGKAGTAVSIGGDFDGDGFDDYVIGGDGQSDGGANAGSAHLFRGGIVFAGTIDLESSYLSLVGVGAADRLGASLSLTGDVDGDDAEDLVVGAPRNDDGAYDGGSVYIVPGNPALSGRVELDSPDVLVLRGTEHAGEAGSAVAVGDANGDGIDDILVGAPLAPGQGVEAGAAYLVWGSGALPDVTHLDGLEAVAMLGDADSGGVGHDVALGDVDGDLAADLIIGAPEQAVSGIWIVPDAAALSGIITYGEAGYPLPGAAARIDLGISVAASDLTASGFAETIVGGPGSADGLGLAVVVLGQPR